MKSTLSKRIYNYHIQKWKLPNIPEPTEWINPFNQIETQQVFKSFHDKYFNDDRKRIYLLGINPGRHGAGVTGVAFTDPIRLQERCGIQNDFEKRRELSSEFVYEVIEAYGGEDLFYRDFIISSVCPLGFVRSGKNYNYYDDAQLYARVEPFIDRHLQSLNELGAKSHAVISLGQGKNYKYLKQLNTKLRLFDEVYKLPHPRWVMQYRLKHKTRYIDEYLELFHKLRSV